MRRRSPPTCASAPAIRLPNPETWFDYSEYGGLAGAVEMCSGVGACRKKLSGTMCPSYMATREESDSTRGRANVLRLAMSGRLDETGLGDDGVYQVLDLCLECRACKSECPVGVDMARFKSEFLADYLVAARDAAAGEGAGQCSSAIGLGQPVRADLELGGGKPAGRWINEKLLGLDHRRALPPWKRETFEKWMARNRKRGARADGRPSRFSTTRSPIITIRRSASPRSKSWSAADAAVDVVRPGCCGRPLISQGLLEDARAHAATVVEALFPIASRGENILFCEPSCLSAVKDDAPSLLRGEQQKKAREVAESLPAVRRIRGEARTAVARRAAEDPAARPLSSKIDGPAAGDDGSSVAHSGVLRWWISMRAAAAWRDRSVISKGHYEVSSAIANRKLLPAVKAMKSGEVLVAPGTSCRRQVLEFNGAKAVHPATLIRGLLANT